VCAVVCAFMICIIVSYGTTVYFSSVGAGCVVCMVDLYIFSIVVLTYMFFTLMLVCEFEREPYVSLRFSLLFIQSNSVLSSSPSTACSLSAIPYTDKNINFAVE
jgi:hypothetical protein